MPLQVPEKKAVLITGCSPGSIGEALAKEFLLRSGKQSPSFQTTNFRRARQVLTCLAIRIYGLRDITAGGRTGGAGSIGCFLLFGGRDIEPKRPGIERCSDVQNGWRASCAHQLCVSIPVSNAPCRPTVTPSNAT